MLIDDQTTMLVFAALCFLTWIVSSLERGKQGDQSQWEDANG